MAKVRIEGKAPFGTEIYVDGNKVNGVSNFILSQASGEMPILNLTIAATELDINSPVKVKADSLADESTPN